ncbi:LytR/AlgR family response regulator transcription factor [Spirosoma litoris]
MTYLSLLLIEDDPVWLDTLQAMAAQLGFRAIRSATTLAQASQLLEEQQPDFIVADMVLPDGLSVELLSKAYPQLPVIFQTAYPREDLLRQAIRMPHIGFLVKPFGLFGLKAALEMLCTQLPGLILHTPKGITIPGKHGTQVMIQFDAIYWIKAEGNYSIIRTMDQKHVLKRSLRKLVSELPKTFIQIQKGYVVNRSLIGRLSTTALEVNQEWIPIGRTYRKQILARIQSG